MDDRLSISALWADTTATIRAHANVFVTLAAAFLFLPQLALSLAMPAGLPAPGGGAAAQVPAWFWPALIAVLVLQLFFAAPAIRMTLGLARAQETVGDMLRDAAARLPRYAGALGLFLLIVAGIALTFGIVVGVIVAATGGARGAAPSPAVALIVLLLAPLMLWGAARLIAWFPVLIAEDPGALNTIKRTWALTRGRAGRIALLLVVIGLAFILASIPVFGLGAALGVTGEVVGGAGLGQFLYAAVNGVVAAGFGMITTVMFAHLYRRLRAGEAARG